MHIRRPLSPTFQVPGRAGDGQGMHREATLGAEQARGPPENACDVLAPGQARGPALGPRCSSPEPPWTIVLLLSPGRDPACPTPLPARGTDPRLWLPCESRSPSTSSTLATFFSLLPFFCAGRSGVRACGARPGQATAEAAGYRSAAILGSWRPHCPAGSAPDSAVPCLAGAPGDLSSGHWPVWVRGGPLRHLLHPAPTRPTTPAPAAR